ncbi:SERTA domain-containing protein 3 [Marasmius crinis-equi]|uniref:SERTA domain-containing protein 3 n=1 Tax=Marasmius crinis-equi TaxID=585013 RepID=A0ABR3FMH8_9AGAR
MPPSPKFKLARLQFLLDNLEGYAEADAEGRGPDFLSELIERFFRRFPVRLDGVEVEPTPEDLEKVDDTEELEEMEEPVKKPGMPDTDFAKAMADFNRYNADRNTLSGQIRNFMNYRNRNRSAPVTKSHRVLLDRLAGVAGGPGRRKTAFNLWAESDEGRSKWQAEVDKRWKDAKDGLVAKVDSESVQNDGKGNQAEGDDGGKNDDNAAGTGEKNTENTAQVAGGKAKKAFVTLRQDVIKAEFAKLSQEEQRQWQERVESDFQARRQAWDSSVDHAYSREPEACQRAIEDLPTWTIPILEGIRAITGMNVSLFAGGPLPADGGNINVMGIHCGSTKETTPRTFGVVHRKNIQQYIVPMFGDFCRKTFSQEDCDSASLGGEHKTGGIFALDTEVMLDRWGEKERLDYWKAVQGANSAGSSEGKGSGAVSTSEQRTDAVTVARSSGGSTASATTSGKPSAASSKSAVPSIDFIAERLAGQRAALAKSGVTSSASTATSSCSSTTAAPGKSRSSTSTSTTVASAQRTPAPRKSLSSSTAMTAPQRNVDVLRLRNPPANSTKRTGGTSSSGRPLPVGGASALRDQEYPSTVNVTKLKTGPRQRTHVAMSTGGTAPRVLKPEGRVEKSKAGTSGVGSAKNPIELGSSPLNRRKGVPPQVKPDPDVIELSDVDSDDSTHSAPAPSPTKNKRPRKSISRSSSPSTVYASPHPPKRPRHVAASSPPESSQPPSSPTPGQTHRSKGKQREREVSPSSTTSADEISAELSRDVGSSPVKESKSKKRKVYVEIASVPPKKRQRKSEEVKKIEVQSEVEEDNLLVPVPKDAPEYVVKVLRLVSRLAVGVDKEAWKSLLTVWLELEAALGFESEDRLTAASRPSCVGDWIQRARSATWDPKPALDVGDHRVAFMKWWKVCQPEWRVGDEGKLARGTGRWDDLAVAGKNGLASVIACIAYGLDALARLPQDGFRKRQTWETERVKWAGIVDEVTYAISETLAYVESGET